MSVRLWNRRIAQVSAAVVGIGLASVAAVTLAWSWRPSDRFPFQGVDVSEANGPIDWWTVRKDGADFAYVRATSGAAIRDPRFEANWAGVYEAGLRRGAMHAYSLCKLASDQANNFNTTVPRTRDALPAAVEIDFAPDCTSRPEPRVVIDELRRFLTMVEAHTGKPVLLKISKPFEAAYGVTAALPRPVWAVQDFFPPEYPARPWRMWQASGIRRIDGVEGPVHWNVVAP